MRKLLIIGAGGHGRVVAEVAELMQLWDEIAFIDDKLFNSKINDIFVVGRLEDLSSLHQDYGEAIVAIGNNKVRLEFLDKLNKIGFKVPVLIHPSAIVSEKTLIDQGSVIMAGVIVNPNVKIGAGCIINTKVSIDHDCVLENGVHLSPGTQLGGTVFVQCQSWIGIGASIINNVVIGKDSIVAAGSAVINDVDANILVAGVPATPKKKLN
jgi:sugar O-acyltransferase (sialic acid O-acetyltransferase NeuD family)